MFNKRFMIEVDMGGVVTFRDTHDRSERRDEGTLPVFSVATEEDAQAIQLTFCRCAYNKDALGNDIYVLNEIGTRALAGKPAELSLSELPGLTQRLHDFIERRELRKLVAQEN